MEGNKMKEYKTIVTKDNTHIEDSYDMPGECMEDYLKELRKAYPYPQYAIWKRSIKSMVREWKAHNVLYKIGYKRDHTRSVDLNMYEPWYRQACYFTLSLFW